MFNAKPICPLVVDLPADLFIILSTNHIFFFIMLRSVKEDC